MTCIYDKKIHDCGCMSYIFPRENMVYFVYALWSYTGWIAVIRLLMINIQGSKKRVYYCISFVQGCACTDPGPLSPPDRWNSQQDVVLALARHVVDDDASVVAQRRKDPGIAETPGNRVHAVLVFLVHLQDAVFLYLPVAKGVGGWMGGWVSGWVSGWVGWWVGEWVSEWVSGWVSE